MQGFFGSFLALRMIYSLHFVEIFRKGFRVKKKSVENSTFFFLLWTLLLVNNKHDEWSFGIFINIEWAFSINIQQGMKMKTFPH